MKPILVTGGAGYIGSHTCKALARAGYFPVCYDNLSRGHKWAVRWGPLEIGDIADGDRVREVIDQYRPMAVLHFAGYGYVGESMSDPSLYYGNNVNATWQFLEVLRTCNVKHLIFSSSCATYGGVHSIPIVEATPQVPMSTYGYSKLVIERMLADYARAYGFRVIPIRYFNAAGADPDNEIGEAHDPEPHFIPNVLRVAAGQNALVRINGDDYPTLDGSCVRDFIHVSDIAEAHVLALSALIERGITGPFNLGNGNGYSLKQIVTIARQVTGCEIPCETGPRLIGDPPYAVGDASLVRQVLGWEPRYADIATIIGSAWRWMEHCNVIERL
jgi:UDP-arabinose 4-epimerase